MKVGDLIRVRHHSMLKNGKIGILTEKVCAKSPHVQRLIEQQNSGFKDRYIVKFTDGSGLSLTAEQCEVISESR